MGTNRGRGEREAIEPSADLRTMSSFLYQLFVALTNEGFTEAQALSVVGQTIHSAMDGVTVDDV